MPLYEYECVACAHRFERIQKFSDPLVDICPKCGGTVRKLFSSPAIQFKGSGWYITDYAKKSGNVESSSSSSSSSSSEGGDRSDKGGKSDKSEKGETDKKDKKDDKKSESSSKASEGPAS
jgi:putative FmdB family regulatory protein